MKFVLSFLLMFSTVFDVCMASSLSDLVSIQAEVDSQKQVAESSQDHGSHKHQGHDFCKQCHSCQNLVTIKYSQLISITENSILETPYQFFIPSAFTKALKRPPKV